MFSRRNRKPRINARKYDAFFSGRNQEKDLESADVLIFYIPLLREATKIYSCIPTFQPELELSETISLYSLREHIYLNLDKLKTLFIPYDLENLLNFSHLNSDIYIDFRRKCYDLLTAEKTAFRRFETIDKLMPYHINYFDIPRNRAQACFDSLENETLEVLMLNEDHQKYFEQAKKKFWDGTSLKWGVLPSLLDTDEFKRRKEFLCSLYNRQEIIKDVDEFVVKRHFKLLNQELTERHLEIANFIAEQIEVNFLKTKDLLMRELASAEATKDAQSHKKKKGKKKKGKKSKNPTDPHDDLTIHRGTSENVPSIQSEELTLSSATIPNSTAFSSIESINSPPASIRKPAQDIKFYL